MGAIYLDINLIYGTLLVEAEDRLETISLAWD